MADSPFIHLHTHSHYSLLEGLSKVKEMATFAEQDGMPALALTDHGNMHGAIDFYKTCKKHNVKPIIGLDAYYTAGSRHEKRSGIDTQRFGLVLLAQNETGYKNLMKLVTRSFLEGFYYKPRIDFELLSEHNEGLVCLSGGPTSELVSVLQNGDTKHAKTLITKYKDLFGDRFFLEILPRLSLPGYNDARAHIIALSKEMNVPLVAAQSSYYLHPDDKQAHETLLSVQQNRFMSDVARIVARGDDFSFIDTQTARKRFQDVPEAVENTQKVADMCNVEISDLGNWMFPEFSIPEDSTYDEELKKLAYQGIQERGIEQTKEVEDRIEYELGIIKDKNYASYFLVVADMLRHAKKEGILTNTRGSAAGSMVSFLAGITSVNPLELRLPFERFLNPERPSLPDIDMDFADNRRDEIIQYMRDKYGEEKVAQIGTFGTMLARGSVRDVARALGYAYETGDRIARLIPLGAQGFPMTIDRAMEETPELKDMYEKEAEAREIIDLAKRIEGCARHVSVHAAGVVIGPKDLTEYTPLQVDPKGGKLITQYDMYTGDREGVVCLPKFDVLGITNLTILQHSVALVKKRYHKDIDVENIPLDDPQTYKMLTRGETVGVFQLAGSGMTRYLMELRPTNIDDINAMVALYRPGPLAFIPDYIKRKRNPQLVRYVDERLKDILEPTYGILIYQDDILLIAVNLAGYSWGEADKFRKAVGKKIPEAMAEQKEKFISGCVDNGMGSKVALELWSMIETFAAYGFNKCLTADTRIVCADTGVPTSIATLAAQNKRRDVYALNKTRNIRRKKASTPFENGRKHIYRLTTRNGKSIRATDNHPFFTFDGWVQLKDLKKGARIATPRHIPEPKKPIALPRHKAATLGYLIAEGNLCHPHGTYFYAKAEDEIKDFLSSAKKFNNMRVTIDRSKSATSVYVGKEKQSKPNELFDWIDEIECSGKRATEKTVPSVVFNAPNDSIAVFLGKMWQGDGAVSIANDQTFYATSSHQLAYDVQHLLLRLSIISTVHTKSFKYRGGRKTGYTIVVSGTEHLTRFAKTAGVYLIGKKKKDMQTLVRQSSKRTNNRGRGTTDTIPADIISLVRSEIQKSSLTHKATMQKAGVSERLLSKDKRKRGYTRESIRKIGEAIDSRVLLQHANADIFWDEVVSIKKDGVEMTYDITVPELSNFVANDIFVHNSHAASYGHLAYQTAYMKANFPAEYMAAVLTAESGDVEKVAEIIAECTHMGMPVLPPDINASFGDFTVIPEDQANTDEALPAGQTLKDAGQAGAQIRFGLYSIKNLGYDISDAIIEERKKNGPFQTFSDFLRRVKHRNLNKKSLEALIKAGAMDALGERGQMLANLERALSFHKEHMETSEAQDSLFGGGDAAEDELAMDDTEPATLDSKLAWEKELLGLYISGHPLEKHKDTLTEKKINNKKVKEEVRSGAQTVVGGIVAEAKMVNTKKGDRMAFVQLEDLHDTIEVVFFPKTFVEYKDFLEEDKCIVIKGKVSDRNGEKSIIADAVKEL